jgi:hypothetical protein
MPQIIKPGNINFINVRFREEKAQAEAEKWRDLLIVFQRYWSF